MLPDAVLHLSVDLRSAEGTVTFVDLVVSFTIGIIHDLFQGCLGVIPYLDIAHIIIRSGKSSERQVRPKVLYRADPGIDPVFGHENMGIIPEKCLYTEEPVQFDGFFLCGFSCFTF